MTRLGSSVTRLGSSVTDDDECKVKKSTKV